MAKIYEQRTGAFGGAAVDMSRCRAEVWSRERWARWHQCTRKGEIEHNGMLFCKQHSPDAEAKRKAEMDERDRLERLKWAHKSWTSEAFGVVKQIADGHNDPMTLAREYMAREPK